MKNSIQRKLRKISILSSITIFTAGIYSSNVLAEDWSYQLEPYIMVTSIKGDASIGQVTGVDVDVDFGTILDNLESAAMVHFEAHHKSGWGLAVDYGYMDLGGSKSNVNGSSINAGVRQGILELQAIYRKKVANGYLDYFAGVRWWDNDIDFALEVPLLPGDGIDREVESDWIDPVVGLRWIRNINKEWTFLAQADLGGLGIGSDFTSSVQTGVQYEISDLMTLNLKYKATWVDFEEGDVGNPNHFEYDTVTHGPIIGLVFNF